MLSAGDWGEDGHPDWFAGLQPHSDISKGQSVLFSCHLSVLIMLCGVCCVTLLYHTVVGAEFLFFLLHIVSGVICDRGTVARLKGKIYKPGVSPAMMNDLDTVTLTKRRQSWKWQS